MEEVNIKELKNLKLLILLLIGAFVALVSVPFLFRFFPSDFKRTELILDKLEFGNANLVSFGNSISMSALDTRVIEKNTFIRPAYNFSSTGQGLRESALFYQNLPSEIRYVIQFISIDELIELQSLKKPTIRSFILCGYNIESITSTFLQSETNIYFKKPKFKIYLDSRNILTDFINTKVRQLVREDLQLDKIDKELYYPNPYTKRINPKAYNKNIERFNPKQQQIKFSPDKNTISLIRKLDSYLRKKSSIEFVLALSPINPDLYNYSGKYKKEIFEVLSKNLKEIKIIDLTQILDDKHFVDHFHVSPSGAKIISNYITNYFEK